MAVCTEDLYRLGKGGAGIRLAETGRRHVEVVPRLGGVSRGFHGRKWLGGIFVRGWWGQGGLERRSFVGVEVGYRRRKGWEGTSFDRCRGLGDLRNVSGSRIIHRRSGKLFLTGVRSRSESASLAEVAASMRSSQREPVEEATFGGSAEKALRPSILNFLA